MKLGLSTTRLCSAADVGRQTYRDAQGGLSRPSPATLAKLNHALKRFSIGFAGEAGAIAPHAAFKACLLLATFATKPSEDWSVDAKAALNADPGRRATSDPVWLAASKTRRIAFSIANQFFGFKISDIARAAGCTKAAVSAAIQELEDQRDHDAQLDALLTRIEDILA